MLSLSGTKSSALQMDLQWIGRPVVDVRESDEQAVELYLPE